MNRDSKHIDEVFRERFQTFEVQPPEYVWDKIKANLPGNNSGTLFSNPVSLASLAAILLIALMLGINFIKQENRLSTPARYSSNTALSPADNNTNQSDVISETNTDQVANQSSPTDLTFTEKLQGPQTVFGKSFTEAEYQETSNIRQKLQVITMGNIHSSTIKAAQSSPEMKYENGEFKPVYHKLNGNTPDYKYKPELVLGAHFSPDVMFYPEDNISNQHSYRFDLSAAVQFSDFFIESGLGLNFSKDQGAYSYDYQKYLGTYDDVYEVTFDSTENGIIPTYHTTPVNVYDSVSESFHPTKNKYTYLEIPLLFGFKKDYKRISWFVKGGPAFAFLIHKNIPEVNITDQDILIGLNENKQPQRVNSNMQLVFGAGVNYRIHKRVSLSFEPVFRYYITSAYERTYIRSKHTYSAGVKAGLLLNF